MTFNLTDKRIECLRYLARQPVTGVYAGALAQEVIGRTNSARGFSSAQATRTGAGYARPLAEAGLVDVVLCRGGWGRVSLNGYGAAVLAAVDCNDGTLAATLEIARTMASYPWSKRT